MPHTLLLADDSVTIQRVIELTFADEDVTVVAVGDGNQAVARLDATPPDIVLADVDMPGRDGYAVARHVRDTPALSRIPVLLLTGAFDPVDDAAVNACGADGVLIKPFEPQHVIARVRELLQQRSVEVLCACGVCGCISRLRHATARLHRRRRRPSRFAWPRRRHPRPWKTTSSASMKRLRIHRTAAACRHVRRTTRIVATGTSASQVVAGHRAVCACTARRRRKA